MSVELDYCEYATSELAQAAYPTNGHHAVTFVGTAQLDTAVYKWGTASLLLDGDSDYLSIPDSADWDICASNTDDWTIDFWVKHTDHVDIECYIGQYEDVNNRWEIYHVHGSGLLFHYDKAAAAIINTGYGGEITDTNWHHVALCKVGSNYGVYLDGTQGNHTDDSDTDTLAGILNIGRIGGGTEYFDGQIDEIRIVHSNIFGAAPNATPDDTITVPTSAHQIDTDTKLLLHLDGSDGATSTKDHSRCDCYSEISIKQQGSYSLKGFADGTDSLNDTLTRTVSPTIDLSGHCSLNYGIYSDRTGSNIKIGIHDSGGTTTEHTANIGSANSWETQSWDISSVSDANKDVIDSIIITVVNADADNTFYIDNFIGLPTLTINVHDCGETSDIVGG